MPHAFVIPLGVFIMAQGMFFDFSLRAKARVAERELKTAT